MAKTGISSLSAYHLQLLDSGGTVNVAGDEQRALSLLLVQTGELCCVSGLSCALQTGHHNDCRRLRGYCQLRLRSAHCLGELFVYYLYYLLTRHQALEHIRTDSALGHALDKVAHDLKVNIRLEQCRALSRAYPRAHPPR